jgi:thioredoxin reductase (NADPH)
MYDLIIIGAGPSGMSAAIYGSRGGLKVAMIEKEVPGGKVMKTSDIENWPGVASIKGPDLAFEMFNHAQKFGAEFIYGNVIDIIDEGTIKKVKTSDNTLYETLAVIIATGTKERKIGIKGEDEYYGKGVSYCAVCDGALYKNKPIAVIGGGNSALEEALYLTRFASKIYLIHRRDEFRAEDIIVNNIKNNKVIELKLKYIPLEINGNNTVNQIVIKNVVNNEVENLEVNAVFPFIGLDPESRFASRLNITNERGYVVTNSEMETDVKGIFAAGDVIEKNLRQIVTASSDGAIAANKVIQYIDELKKNNK